MFNEYRVTKGVFYYPDASKSFPPGSTIIVPSGDYDESSFLNLKGTADKRITIKFEKNVRLGYKPGARYGLNIRGEYFDIVGPATVVPSDPNTFLNSGISLGNSSDYTITGITLINTQVGFFSNPSEGRLMKNISLIGNTIRNTGNPAEKNRCEAIYFGNTSQQFSSVNAPYRFQNLVIKDNIFEELMGDGIQVAICEGLTISGNQINGYGKNNLDGQMCGIQLGAATYNVLVEDNIIRNGNGIGLFVGGCGEITIANNTFLNCGQSDLKNQDIIYISNKTPDNKFTDILLKNNIISDGKRHGINNVNEGGAVQRGNSIKVDGKPLVGFQDVVPDPPKKTLKQTIFLYSDNTYEVK